ncbi:hypothetical protein IEO21_07033 [Rhodonia placenta]|uniref:Uncharacterized protein n=1 Tax=Rhodonia placenta TaxID=104341 RepID=A0A8H7U0Q9_9APHY|nr:hypothetical protein IEO21_07033 [Postia placenta]
MLAAALVSALVSAAAAAPNLAVRQSGSPPCYGLGGLHVYENLSNFTLSALNTTLPNANSTGAPLVLASNNVNWIPAASTVLATYASFPPDIWPGPEFSLVNGALIPAPNGNLVGYDANVTSGYGLGFAVTDPENEQSGAEIYCVQDNGAPSGFQHAYLAVFGDTANFSLCTSLSVDAEQPPQNQVIYKATSENNDQYDYNSCYAVQLIIQAP